MSSSTDNYARFRAGVAEVSTLSKQSREKFASLAMSAWVDATDKLLHRLASERFRVIVLGEFKRGKSTFINAMLGAEALPAFVTPCTAVIVEVKWGPEKRAVLHFRDPLPPELPRSLPPDALAHIERHRGRTTPCLPIAIEDLESYVVIPDPTKDQAASIAETPYDRVEVFWPMPLLKDGVEIIDSPGLNEHGNRTKVTMDYLPSADAVIFVFSVHAMAGHTELTVIDRDVREKGRHEYVFFVCNRFDELKRAADRERVVSYSYKQLSDRTKLGRDGVFFISALDAVIGREENRPDLVERSNLPGLESAVSKFLVNERGRVKLLQPASLLAQGLKTALLEVLPQQRKMLETDFAELERRYAAVEPQLAEADTRRRSIVERMERSRRRIRESVMSAASLHFGEVAENVPLWASSLEIESRISAWKFYDMNGQVKALAEEVIAGVVPQVEEAGAAWSVRRLQPLLREMLEDMGESAKDSVQSLTEKLAQIRADVTQLAPKAELDEGNISTMERVLSAAGGWILFGPGSGLEGATLGFKGMVRGIVPQLALLCVGVAVLHMNPVTLIPAMIGLGLFRTFSKGQSLTVKAKADVGKKLADALKESIPEQAERIAKLVDEQTEPIVRQIDADLTNEIQSIREQVEAALVVKQAGVAEVARRLETLAKTEEELRQLDGKVSEFILKLAQRTAA